MQESPLVFNLNCSQPFAEAGRGGVLEGNNRLTLLVDVTPFAVQFDRRHTLAAAIGSVVFGSMVNLPAVSMKPHLPFTRTRARWS